MYKNCWYDKAGRIMVQVLDIRFSEAMQKMVSDFYEFSQDGDLLVSSFRGEDEKWSQEVTWKNNGGYVSMVE